MKHKYTQKFSEYIGIYYLVEGLQITDGWGHCFVIWELINQVCNEHAKLCAPITKMT